MKLYYAPWACSLAPHIVAREAGLDIELERVAFPAKLTEGGRDFRQINPKGEVPALELDDGEILTENAVILQYLAALRPQAGLAPESGMAHWRLLELLNFIATELHKGFAPLFHPEAGLGSREPVLAALGPRLGLLHAQLGDKPFLLGQAFTVADAYAFVVLNWARLLKVDLSPWPRLGPYAERIHQRPAVRAALAEEGLIVRAPGAG